MSVNYYQELPFNPKLLPYAKTLRKAGNLSEVLLWLQLKNKQFKGLDFDRQRVIGNYIVDFYCSENKTVIEIDGITHDYKQEHDAKREAYLKSLGLRIIHLLDSDIKKNLAGVMQFLELEI
ncbi:MAG: endonuclease domain-containing protein [Firmicutes bacterium]|nr:endonuclease domain-containing protein [Bacillota bacterium]